MEIPVSWTILSLKQKPFLIAVLFQLCHSLLVYAAVQQSGDEEVTQGVQMVFGVESISGVNLP